MGLLEGPRGRRFLMSEVPLYMYLYLALHARACDKTPDLRGPISSFTCDDYNTYRAHRWSPFPLRRAHPGPGPRPLNPKHQ